MIADQMSYMTYSALSAVSAKQFLNLSSDALRGIRANSLGGFSPDVLAQFTVDHLNALDPVIFSKLPSEDMSKILTHFDLKKINAEAIHDLLPKNWFFDLKTGKFNAPAGTPLNLKTLNSNLKSVNMPELPQLNSGLALGGTEKITTILEGMNQALAQNNLAQFKFVQDSNGIVKAADDSNLQFTFIPNKESFVQADDNTTIEIQIKPHDLRIITLEKQALSLIPAPKDMILLRNILPYGEIYMDDKGDVIFNYANVKDNYQQNDDAKYDVIVCVFDAFVDSSFATECHSDNGNDINTCKENNMLGVKITHQTGYTAPSGEYQSPEGHVIYDDLTAQTIYPAIIEPHIFLTMLHQIDGLEDIKMYQNGAYLLIFEGNSYILQPDFTATAYKLPIGEQFVSPTIRFQEGGFLAYTIVFNNIEYTQKLFIYPLH